MQNNEFVVNTNIIDENIMDYELDDELNNIKEINIKEEEKPKSKLKIESYENRTNQLNIIMDIIKDPKNYNKDTKKNIAALTKHLQKLTESQTKNILYHDFEKNIIEHYKINKDINKFLKNAYLDM